MKISIVKTVKTLSALMLACLAGCGAQAWLSAPLYRCEAGVEFRARFIDSGVVIDGSRGYDILYLDAGGTGQQTVYSNSRMKAEFGGGASAKEAILRYPLLPLVLRCVRD